MDTLVVFVYSEEILKKYDFTKQCKVDGVLYQMGNNYLHVKDRAQQFHILKIHVLPFILLVQDLF